MSKSSMVSGVELTTIPPSLWVPAVAVLPFCRAVPDVKNQRLDIWANDGLGLQRARAGT